MHTLRDTRRGLQIPVILPQVSNPYSEWWFKKVMIENIWEVIVYATSSATCPPLFIFEALIIQSFFADASHSKKMAKELKKQLREALLLK